MSYFLHPGGRRLIATVFSCSIRWHVQSCNFSRFDFRVSSETATYIPLILWSVYSFQKRALAGVPWFHAASKPGEGHMPSWKGRRRSTRKSLTVRTSINHGLRWTLKYDSHLKRVWFTRLKQIRGNCNSMYSVILLCGILFMFFWLQQCPNQWYATTSNTWGLMGDRRGIDMS